MLNVNINSNISNKAASLFPTAGLTLYKQAVEADGGSLENETNTKAFLQRIGEPLYNKALLLLFHEAGSKLRDSQFVTKWYDFKNNHATQATESSQPALNSGIDFSSGDWLTILSALSSFMGREYTVTMKFSIDNYGTVGSYIFNYVFDAPNRALWGIADDETIQLIGGDVTCQTVNYDDSNFHNLAFVCDKDLVSIYYKGVFIGSEINTSFPSVMAGVKDFMIGNWDGNPGSNYQLDGKMQELCVFNKVLDFEEVLKTTDTIIDTEWEEIANYPIDYGVNQHNSCEYDGEIYILGGLDGVVEGSSTLTNKFYKYNPTTDSYTQLTNAPNIYQSFVIETVGTKMYLLSGAGKSVIIAECYEYDPVANSWTQLTDIPTPIEDMGGCVYDGKVYVIGGWDGVTVYAKIQIYDPSTDTWDVTKTDAPVGMCLGDYVTQYNGYIYAISGNESMATYPDFTSSTRVQRYNTATDTWDEVAAIPTGGSYTKARAYNGKIYILGGVVDRVASVNQKLTNTLRVYDIATNAWTEEIINNYPYPLRGHTMGILNGTLYVFSGNNVQRSYDGENAAVFRNTNRCFKKVL